MAVGSPMRAGNSPIAPFKIDEEDSDDVDELDDSGKRDGRRIE